VEGQSPQAVLLHGDSSHYEHSLLALPGEFVAGAWTPKGDRLAILTSHNEKDPPALLGRLEIRSAEALSAPPRTIELPFLPSQLAVNPKQDYFFIGDNQGGVWKADLNSPQPLTSWIPQAQKSEGQDQALVFSASGKCLIRCRAQGRIEVWDTTSQRLRFTSDTPMPSASRRWITASPTEPHLLITDLDGTSQVIHLDDGRALGNQLQHPGGVVAQGFSPDGRWVVTSGHDGCLRINDWRTGGMICPPLVHEDEVFGFDFATNGNWLASACRDGTFLVWDTKTGTKLLSAGSVHEPLFDVKLSSNNRWAVLTGKGSTTWICSLPIMQEVTDWSAEELATLSETTSCLAIDQDQPTILSSADWQDRLTRILALRADYFRP
jgi:WD40 repeat protein